MKDRASDPFRRLGIRPTADPALVQTVVKKTLAEASASELKTLEPLCTPLLSPDGLARARLLSPSGGQSFADLVTGLPPRLRYLGPGRWKKLVYRLHQLNEHD